MVHNWSIKCGVLVDGHKHPLGFQLIGLASQETHQIEGSQPFFQ